MRLKVVQFRAAQPSVRTADVEMTAYASRSGVLAAAAEATVAPTFGTKQKHVLRRVWVDVALTATQRAGDATIAGRLKQNLLGLIVVPCMPKNKEQDEWPLLSLPGIGPMLGGSLAGTPAANAIAGNLDLVQRPQGFGSSDFEVPKDQDFGFTLRKLAGTTYHADGIADILLICQFEALDRD